MYTPETHCADILLYDLATTGSNDTYKIHDAMMKNSSDLKELDDNVHAVEISVLNSE